jgi:hypothetical protein
MKIDIYNHRRSWFRVWFDWDLPAPRIDMEPPQWTDTRTISPSFPPSENKFLNFVPKLSRMVVQ